MIDLSGFSVLGEIFSDSDEFEEFGELGILGEFGEGGILKWSEILLEERKEGKNELVFFVFFINFFMKILIMISLGFMY